MITALYSDPHFGHANIIEYENRPFNCPSQMDESLITNYNSVVGEDDAVLWLGDCFFQPSKRAAELMGRLNGSKLLILGNHDGSASSMLRLGFDAVMDVCFMLIGGRKCRLCHYPYAGSDGRGEPVDDRFSDMRPPRVPGEILVHGHTHSRRRIRENAVHVGVDAWDYGPVRIERLDALIRKSFPTESKRPKAARYAGTTTE